MMNASACFVRSLDGVRIAAMAKNCHNDYKMKFSVDEEFPDLSLHNNHMAKVLFQSKKKKTVTFERLEGVVQSTTRPLVVQVLNKEIYGKLRSKSTPSGFTLDDVIQTGVDNPGKDVDN